MAPLQTQGPRTFPATTAATATQVALALQGLSLRNPAEPSPPAGRWRSPHPRQGSSEGPACPGLAEDRPPWRERRQSNQSRQENKTKGPGLHSSAITFALGTAYQPQPGKTTPCGGGAAHPCHRKPSSRPSRMGTPVHLTGSCRIPRATTWAPNLHRQTMEGKF